MWRSDSLGVPEKTPPNTGPPHLQSNTTGEVNTLSTNSMLRILYGIKGYIGIGMVAT